LSNSVLFFFLFNHSLSFLTRAEKTYQYEMNVDVQMGNKLYGKFYEAKWIPKKNSSIILLLMNEETARKEVPFYLKFNTGNGTFTNQITYPTDFEPISIAINNVNDDDQLDIIVATRHSVGILYTECP